jgi:hypothetical protein
MRYKLEALDSDGGTRASVELPPGATAQDVAGAVILRVPTSMHLNDQTHLGERLRVALRGKAKAAPLVFVVPDYVTACRLVEVKEAAE